MPMSIELDAAIALDPRKRILLSDRHQHLVAVELLIRFASGTSGRLPVVVEHGLDFLEGHAGQADVLMQKRLRHQVVEDRDALVHARLLSPMGTPSFRQSRNAR